MNKIIFALFVMIITALPAMAAPGDTSGPWGVRAAAFANLSTALASPSTAGKTVVVDAPMTINTMTTDRAIEVKKGGSITVNSGQTLTINGSFSAGLYQVFSGTGAVKLLAAGYIRPDWFGTNAMPGITDMAPAWTKAIASCFASGISTIRADNSYYFATPVELPNYQQDLHITGVAMAGWIKTTALQGQITGAAGIEGLFKFTAATGGGYGGGALEIDHIRFDGGDKVAGVVSALYSTASGGPARPVHIHNCQFVRFAKAIHSNIGAGATGISAIGIDHNTFYLSDYSVYGTGNGALQNLSFTNNVSEQGGKIGGANGAFSGSLTITDNQLEGQADTIDIVAGTCQALIARNYFESNTGKIINFTASASGYVEVGPNYYANTVSGTISVTNAELIMRDTALPTTVTTVYNRLLRKSRVAPLTYLANTASGFINSLDPAMFPTLFDNQAVIATGKNWRVDAALIDTPAGKRGKKMLTAPATSFQYPLTTAVTAGDYIVVTMLVKNVSAATIKALLYTSAGVYITESSQIGLSRAGEFSLVHMALRTSVTDASGVKVAFQTDAGSVLITDFYLYAVAAPTVTTPMYVYLPPLYANGTASVLASQTSVTVNTGLDVTPATLKVIPNANAGYWWVDTLAAGSFKINVGATTGADRAFMWEAN